MAVKLARVFAALAIAAWIRGAWMLERAFYTNIGRALDSWFLWTAIPLAAVVGVLLLSWRRSAAGVWMLAGVCCSFVVIGAWSAGTFFFWPAVLLLLAATAQTFAVRARWRALLIPVWLASAFTGTCALFVAIHKISMIGSSGTMTEASLLVWGSWAFAGLVVFLVIERAAERAVLHS